MSRPQKKDKKSRIKDLLIKHNNNPDIVYQIIINPINKDYKDIKTSLVYIQILAIELKKLIK